MRDLKSLAVGVLGVAAISGCSDNNSNASSSSLVDSKLSQIIESNGLTGNPAAGRTIPSVNDPKVQLGMKLFFSKSLGGDQDAACVSCHHPALGGGDDLSLPIGVGADDPHLLGPGRTHGTGDVEPTVPRNAPTTFNIALWDQVLFHDGRVESLGKTAGKNGGDGIGIRTPDSAFGVVDPNAGTSMTAAQARFPVTSAAEMRGNTYAPGTNDVLRAALQARLKDTANPSEIDVDGSDDDGFNNWVEAFEAVYASTTPSTDIITFDRVADAIAAYESSQTFVNTPWKSYVEGDTTALTESQKRGAILFFTSVSEGGAGCSSCHSGDFFSDEGFHNIALPQIGEGKGDGVGGHDDFGRMRETQLISDQYAFRTPSLLNVEHTGPFGHSGAYDSLEDMITHHLNPANAIDDYFSAGGQCSNLAQLADASPAITCEDITGTDPLDTEAEDNTRLALAKLTADQAAGLSSLVNVELNAQGVSDLVSFMEALTDPCLEDTSCIGQWILENSENVIDGNQLIAEDQNGSAFTAN